MASWRPPADTSASCCATACDDRRLYSGDLPCGLAEHDGELAQQPRPVAAPGAAVHAGQRRRALAREALERSRASAARARSSPSAARNASLGPRMSDSVSATSPCPPCVNRSPQKNVRVVVVHHEPAFPAVRHVRRVEPAHLVRGRATSSSPSASARGARSAKSPTETIAASWPHTGTAFGAAARNALSAPHSSASKCEKPDVAQPLERHHARGSPRSPAETVRAGPVWNSIGASSTIRYWLKLNCRAAGQRDRRVDAEDALGDLLDVGAGLRVRDHGAPPRLKVLGMCNERPGRYTSQHVFARTRHFVCSAHGLRGSGRGRRRGARTPDHRLRARRDTAAEAEICRRLGRG